MSDKTKEVKFIHCPFCGASDTLTMKKERHTAIKENRIVKGIFEIWTCSKCNEGFFHKWDLTSKPIIPTDKA